MNCFHAIDLDEMSPNAAFAARSVRQLASRRARANAQAVFSPVAVASAALLAFGVYALLTLTGVGPDSWQVQVCAKGYAQARACWAVPLAVEPARTAQGMRTGTPS